MVAWAWPLAPVPRLGAHFQTAIGPASTVFFVGFETRPRGKQRELVLKSKAAGGFRLPWTGTGSLRGRTGGGGGLPELCFRQCQALGPVVLWSLSQGRGSVERARSGRPSGSASERASSFEILWRWGLWKRRKGKVSEDVGVGEDSTEVPQHAPCPGELPLSLSKAGNPGTGLHSEVPWLHPESQAERRGQRGKPPTPLPHTRRNPRDTGRQKGNQIHPQNKGYKKATPTKTTSLPRLSGRDIFSPCLDRCLGNASMGLLPDYPPPKCQREGA